MSHAEYSVTVDRPARDVFDYLADGTHNREWRSGGLDIERPTASAGAGAAVRQALDLRPAGLMKLMTPMIARQMRREVAQLETLKKVLEQAVPR